VQTNRAARHARHPPTSPRSAPWPTVRSAPVWADPLFVAFDVLYVGNHTGRAVATTPAGTDSGVLDVNCQNAHTSAAHAATHMSTWCTSTLEYRTHIHTHVARPLRVVGATATQRRQQRCNACNSHPPVNRPMRHARYGGLCPAGRGTPMKTMRLCMHHACTGCGAPAALLGAFQVKQGWCGAAFSTSECAVVDVVCDKVPRCWSQTVDTSTW
jgi:hypothetical protein